MYSVGIHQNWLENERDMNIASAVVPPRCIFPVAMNRLPEHLSA
jgi:hypothetical protein